MLREVAHDLWDDDEFDGVIIEEPEVWGVEAIDADAITLRVTLKTAPMEQWRSRARCASGSWPASTTRASRRRTRPRWS